MLWTSRRTKLGAEGFTLPEILVVISIVAILGAIAVPTFMGAKRAGNDSLAQANAKTAIAAERTYYVDYQTYTADANALKSIESQLDFTTTDAERRGVMAVVSGTQAVVVASWSKSGTLYCMMNIAVTGTTVNSQSAAGTYYLKKENVTTPPAVLNIGSCGTTGWTLADTGWQ